MWAVKYTHSRILIVFHITLILTHATHSIKLCTHYLQNQGGKTNYSTAPSFYFNRLCPLERMNKQIKYSGSV